MKDTFEKRGRGHPRRHPIDELKTRVWYYELSRHARTSKPEWVWQQIDNHDHVKLLNQSKLAIDEHDLKGSWSKWTKYKSGITVPTLHAGKDSVEEAAKYYPCSDHIFRSPLWSILKKEPVSTREARTALLGLHSPVREIVQSVALVPPCGSLPVSFSFDSMLNQLSEIPTLDTYQAIVLLLAWADDEKATGFWNKVCSLYRTMIPEFLLAEEIPFLQELLLALDEIAKERLFYHDVFRSDVDRSWQEELPRFRAILKQHYASCLKCHYMFFQFTDDKFPKETRNTLAEFIVEVVWQREGLKFQSRDLWQPLSKFILTRSLNGKKTAKVTDEELLEQAFKAIDGFFKEKKKRNKLDENPLVGFDSESYVLSRTFNKTHVFHPDITPEDFY